MSYHPITPGILAGNIVRVNLPLASVNNLLVDPNYVINRQPLWNSLKKLELILSVPAGVTIGSTLNSAAMTITGFNSLLHKITLVVNGNIHGTGGAGGASTNSSTVGGSNGAAGGDALRLENNIILINNGNIRGGSGGNGGDGSKRSANSDCLCPSAAGYCAYQSGTKGKGPTGDCKWNNCVNGQCGTCTDASGCNSNQIKECQNKHGSNTRCWRRCNCGNYVTSYTYSFGTAGTNGSNGGGTDGSAGTTHWTGSPGGSGGAKGISIVNYDPYVILYSGSGNL
jgi:hypothetical protein